MRTALLLILAFALPAFSIAQTQYEENMEAFSTALTAAVEKSGKQRIAALDFTDPEGKSNELGLHLSEDLRYYLLKVQPSFTLLDRSSLDRVLEEQRLSAEAIVDEQQAIELGKLMAADAIVFGTVRVNKRTAFLTAKLIDTETGALLAMERSELRIPRSFAREYTQRNPERLKGPKPIQEKTRKNSGAPIEWLLETGGFLHHQKPLPYLGANLVFRSVQAPRLVYGRELETKGGQGFSLGVKYFVHRIQNSTEIGLGYRSPTESFDDSNTLYRIGSTNGIQAGDVWLLNTYEESFNYLFPGSLSQARIAHVQLSNFRTQHLYLDAWYKFYLSEDHIYSNATVPFLGFGLALNMLFYQADFTGVEALILRDSNLGGSVPSFSQQLTPIDDARFPFDGFKNHLSHFDWNAYIGVERNRIGAVLRLGFSTLLGGSPLIRPYLNPSLVSDRNTQRKLEENGLLVFDTLLSDGSWSSASGNDVYPFQNRFSASLSLTYSLR